jgi:hypothetical protein
MDKQKLIPIDHFRKLHHERIMQRKNSNNGFRMESRQPTVAFPDKFDLCKYTPFVFDQGRQGSCTANATLMMYMIQRKILGYEPVVFSRRWLYFMERFRETLEQQYNELPNDWFGRVQTEGNIVTGDNGADANDGILTLLQYGCPLESNFPYVLDGTDPAANKIPPPSLNSIAKWYIPKNGSDIYVDSSDNTLTGTLLDPESLKNAIKNELFVNKRPVILGFECYAPDQYTNPISLDDNGILQLPPSDFIVVGGHEVTIVGWDDSKGFLIQNSWGPGFGIRPPNAKSAGYFYMSYSYALHINYGVDGIKYDIAAEFRTIKMDPKNNYFTS